MVAEEGRGTRGVAAKLWRHWRERVLEGVVGVWHVR